MSKEIIKSDGMSIDGAEGINNQSQIKPNDKEFENLRKQVDELKKIANIVIENEKKKSKFLLGAKKPKYEIDINEKEKFNLLEQIKKIVVFSGKKTYDFTKKTLKFVAKGAVKLSNVAFKAVKGTAKIALEKAEENRRNKATNIAALGKVVSEDLVNYFGNEIKKKEVNIDLLTDETKKEAIYKIRKNELEDKVKFQRDLKDEYSKSIKDVRQALYKIRNAKASEKLLSEYGLSEGEISNILNEVKLGQEGELVLPDGVNIPREKLRGTDLQIILKKLASIPKINRLNDIQILTLAKAIKIENGEISFNLSEETQKRDKQLVMLKNVLSGKEFYVDGIETNLNGVQEKCEVAEFNKDLLDEIGLRDEFNVAVDLRNQMSFIFEKIFEISSKDQITSSEKQQREDFRKIAEKKVKELENVRIVSTIQKGSEVRKKIIINGRNVLTPLKSVERISGEKLKNKDKKKEEKASNENSQRED